MQVIRDPLLELVTHMVVAKGSMADACMQLLVSSLFVLKGPGEGSEVAGEGWQPRPEELLIQDDVIACLRKVQPGLVSIFSATKTHCVQQHLWIVYHFARIFYHFARTLRSLSVTAQRYRTILTGNTWRRFNRGRTAYAFAMHA